MGKIKKPKTKKPSFRPFTKGVKPKTVPSSQKAPVNQPLTIPFDPADRILLVGEGEFKHSHSEEGDFSFANSLSTHHVCTSLLATCFDSHSALLEKYPQAASHIKAVETEEGAKVSYGVDATKLDKGGKEVRKGNFDRIIFNFPHVGGLTKDVNRQVRHNQELLVGFFKSALPLKAPSGSIIITVFEGEPYDLWNVRDLARHVGLKVGRSFNFQPAAYPGYKHARTLGNIDGGRGWKGENRAARTYIFETKDMQEAQQQMSNRKEEDSDSDE